MPTNKLPSDKWPLHVCIQEICVRTFILAELRQASAPSLSPRGRARVCSLAFCACDCGSELSCSRHWKEFSAACVTAC